jgi:hypothetical protein
MHAGHLANLRDTIEGVPAHFVYNLDELGHQPWADAKVATCISQAEYTERTVYYHVSRQEERITLIAWVAADDSHLRLAVIIPRKTYDDDLCICGLTMEKIDVYVQGRGYTGRAIFEDRFRDTFVAEVVEGCNKYNYHGPAYLIMDDCSDHSGDTFLDHHSNVFVSITSHTAVLARRHPHEARVSEQTDGCDAMGSEELRKTEIEYPGIM